MFSLKGKVAIVTGSERGIGKGIAIIFAKAGANVVVTCQDKKKCDETCQELEKLGIKTLSIACDVSKEKDVEQLVSETVKKFGRVDVFVNNAGVLLQKPIDEVTEKEWNWLQDINLKGVFFGIKYAAKQMKKQKTSGSIINIASIAALIGYSMLSTYCASKGGIVALTRSSAIELAPNGIRVNAICPGLIETPMTADMLENKKTRDNFINSIPLRIAGQPEDIGHGALYLASNEARYVTGIELIIDGGGTCQ